MEIIKKTTRIMNYIFVILLVHPYRWEYEFKKLKKEKLNK
jgi:hypothetical protein